MEMVATDPCVGQGLPACTGRAHVGADLGHGFWLAAMGWQDRQPTARPSHDRVGVAKRSSRRICGQARRRGLPGRAPAMRSPAGRPINQSANPSISTRKDAERDQPSVDFIGVSSIIQIITPRPTPGPRMIFLKNTASLCPTCRHEEPNRIPRSLWMKILGVDMAFKCNWCGKRFMVRSKARLRFCQ